MSIIRIKIKSLIYNYYLIHLLHNKLDKSQQTHEMKSKIMNYKIIK